MKSESSLNDLDVRVYDSVRAAASVEHAVERVRYGYGLHHVTFHLGHTAVETIDAPYVKTTYPAEWVGRYLVKRYFLCDPVVKAGFQLHRPFHWCEVEMPPEAAALMADAREFNIGDHGFSIPVIDKDNRRSLLSITTTLPWPEWEAFLVEQQEGLLEISISIHHRSLKELYGAERPFTHLSSREIECLSLTAQGKDSKDIAIILNLSENTTKAYLKSIRGKLDCSTMAQAVAKAIQHRIISR